MAGGFETRGQEPQQVRKGRIGHEQLQIGERDFFRFVKIGQMIKEPTDRPLGLVAAAQIVAGLLGLLVEDEET